MGEEISGHVVKDVPVCIPLPAGLKSNPTMLIIATLRTDLPSVYDIPD